MNLTVTTSPDRPVVVLLTQEQAEQLLGHFMGVAAAKDYAAMNEERPDQKRLLCAQADLAAKFESIFDNALRFAGLKA